MNFWIFLCGSIIGYFVIPRVFHVVKYKLYSKAALIENNAVFVKALCMYWHCALKEDEYFYVVFDFLGGALSLCAYDRDIELVKELDFLRDIVSIHINGHWMNDDYRTETD